MELSGTRIILTGAAGGIGNQLAHRLAASGARLFMLGRSEAGAELAQTLTGQGADVTFHQIDLLQQGAVQQVVSSALTALGGIDLLINLAGSMSFESFVAEDPAVTERLMRLNVLVPMQLCQAVLPYMLEQKRGRIVNIGSIFGSIGFAYFATYSASKFALRGFSEALRRELAGNGVGVGYIAPRATKTSFNDDSIYRMGQTVKMKFDDPDYVAGVIVASIRADKDEAYIGWPERFFVRLNALLPRVVDNGVSKQNRQAEQFVRPVRSIR
jgi:short-subunit dehydrogenase